MTDIDDEAEKTVRPAVGREKGGRCGGLAPTTVGWQKKKGKTHLTAISPAWPCLQSASTPLRNHVDS